MIDFDKNRLQTLSEEEKKLFSDESLISLKSINKKLNILIDFMTSNEEGMDVKPEEKGIQTQNNELLSSDTIQGQFMVQQMMKNLEMEASMITLGSGMVQILLSLQGGE